MKTQTRQADALDATTRSWMCSLLAEHFEGVTQAVFEADLADKTHAVLLYDEAGAPAGFSTFALYTADGPDGEPATIVCSGDTIIAERARGSTALPSAWVRAVHQLHAPSGHRDLYWLLITSGYRTYRFLPVFVRDYHPAPQRDTPDATRRFIHRLAKQRWGAQYNPRTGIVRLTHAQPLKPRLSRIPPGRRADKHIAFFLEHNPGHAAGDELVGLAKLNTSNLTPAGRRMLGNQPADAGARPG